MDNGQIMSEYRGFISVHLGAGHHSTCKTPDYKRLCKDAIKHGINLMHDGVPVLETVVEVVGILENSPLTNAGFGSSLTDAGEVECDASVMEGKSQRYGAVGAVSCIKNPITLAKQLLIHQTRNKLTHGRIPPAFLVASGAKDWALRHGISLVSQKEMISDDVYRMYQKWQKKLAPSQNVKKSLEDVCNLNEDYKIEPNIFGRDVNDTVGAVGVDVNGEIVAAVSSGGLMMKQPGRVGPAAVFGSGCWAQQNDLNAIAATTTGCGESLIRTIFARECCRAVENQFSDPSLALQHLYSDTFLKSTFHADQSERLAGSLVLIYDVAERRGEVVLAHTTDSMCVGFMSSMDRKPSVRMSRLPLGTCSGQSVVVEGSPFDLKSRH